MQSPRRNKVATSSGLNQPKLKKLLDDVEVCGQFYRIVEDNKMKEYGLTIPTENLIKLRTKHEDGSPVSYWNLLDTYLHELYHAWLDASGMGWALRQRLKMSKKTYNTFEEDFLVRPGTPPMLGTLIHAKLLNLPPLPGRPRHRRG